MPSPTWSGSTPLVFASSGKAHRTSRPDGALRVLTSQDGDNWESAALIASPTSDLRDAKITITPDGQLMLSGAGALQRQSKHTHQSLAWFSKDGHNWSDRHDIGDPDFWLWRVTWHKDTAYGIGYGCGKDQSVRLYSSKDGKKFDTLVERLFDVGYPNESSLVLTRHLLLPPAPRRQAKQRPARYFAAALYEVGVEGSGHEDRRAADAAAAGWALDRGGAVVRRDGSHVAGLGSIRRRARLREFLKLPSGGDTSYAGLVLHDGLLWVSYYSRHEGKTSIYLAKAHLPAMKAAALGGAPLHRVPWTTSGVHGTPRAAAALPRRACLSAAHLHFPAGSRHASRHPTAWS